jgi:hypothetical protein
MSRVFVAPAVSPGKPKKLLDVCGDDVKQKRLTTL